MESVDGRTVAQPSAPTVYVTEMGRRVDNNRYSVMVPASRLVNVDVRENIPMVCFVGLSAGGKSLVAWREFHGQP